MQTFIHDISRRGQKINFSKLSAYHVMSICAQQHSTLGINFHRIGNKVALWYESTCVIAREVGFALQHLISSSALTKQF